LDQSFAETIAES